MASSTLRMLLVTVALCALVAAVCAAPRRPKASSSNNESYSKAWLENEIAALQSGIETAQTAMAYTSIESEKEKYRRMIREAEAKIENYQSQL